MKFSLSEQACHFFSKLNSLIGFNMFIDVTFVNDIFGFERSEISDLAASLGFGSNFAVVNNSSVYMTLVGFLLIALISKLLSLVESNCQMISTIKAKIMDALCWSGFCEFINCAYLVLAIGFGLNSTDLNFSSRSFAFNSTLAISNALVTVCFPVWLVYNLRRGWMIKAPETLLNHYRGSVFKMDKPLYK